MHDEWPPTSRGRPPEQAAGARDITISRDEAGGFTIDATMLARWFGWSQEELHDMMRRGLVTSRVERGEGDDLGRWRLSVHCGNRRWQAIVEADGAIADQIVDFIPPRRQPAAD